MSKHILAVDDSRTMRDMILHTLEASGYTVSQATDGVDALAQLAKTRVDLVITDLNMPKMDGFSFIKKLRETPATKFTPVIILTTESDEAKKAQGRAAGATGWIVKPFDPDKLREVVRKVCP